MARPCVPQVNFTLDLSSEPRNGIRVWWGLCFLLAALACLPPVKASAAAPCEGAVNLVGPTGSVIIVGGPPLGQQWRVCTWRVKLDTTLNVISFRTSSANFGDQDYFELLDVFMNALGNYSGGHPLPQKIDIKEKSGVTWRLNTRSADTRIEMSYAYDSNKDTAFIQIFNANLSELQFGIILGAIMLICLCGAWIPVVFADKVFGRRQQGRIVESSQVMPHGQHMLTLGQELALEQWVETHLEQLPQGTYQEQTGALDQCCLCLEDFLAEDMVRILSCDHYFHKECIDRWFQSRRFKVRRCPLCNAHSVPPGSCPGPQSSAGTPSASMPMSTNTPPPATSVISIGVSGHADSQSPPGETMTTHELEANP